MISTYCQLLDSFYFSTYRRQPVFSLCEKGGNPAAVCLLEKDIGDDLKQSIASEMNLSETAFVVLAKDSGSFETSDR